MIGNMELHKWIMELYNWIMELNNYGGLAPLALSIFMQLNKKKYIQSFCRDLKYIV